MNIDEMPAGRELDALVAERVMGWTGVTVFHQIHCGVPPEGDRLREGYDVFFGVKVTVPNYSTDLAAAWEVVEHLHSVNDMVFWLTYYPVGGWYATFENLTGATLEREVICDSPADSAPLAICRSALKFAECMEGKDEHR